jgi:hypothetical protein
LLDLANVELQSACPVRNRAEPDPELRYAKGRNTDIKTDLTLTLLTVRHRRRFVDNNLIIIVGN